MRGSEASHSADMMRGIAKAATEPRKPKTSPRERMIRSAALLMPKNGVHGTSFNDVLAHSGAPRGSIYHHFPDGKEQLIEEATVWAGEFIADWQSKALERHDPVAAVDDAFELWKALLEASDFGGGCPIVAATLSGDATRAAKAAATEAFRKWQQPIAEALVAEGVAEARAQSLATFMVGAFEGGVILARAEHSLTPLERITAEIRGAVASAVAEAQPKQRAKKPRR
jgi:AcrR family transcriptional regulator